ncbi:hypothetical protein DPEC_G00119420 [Dallia pectoralis]|uniref:Uncharacterized protein n=1 Tax=Dallia pectoralis TaxID=75939 RepID=A0ACC2GPU4_DALPE|nr:hypothetical protein DPEC_G00119420 [Dallia pectoralis]
MILRAAISLTVAWRGACWPYRHRADAGLLCREALRAVSGCHYSPQWDPTPWGSTIPRPQPPPPPSPTTPPPLAFVCPRSVHLLALSTAKHDSFLKGEVVEAFQVGS